MGFFWWGRILTPAQRKECAHAFRSKGFHVLDDALNQVKSEEAKANDDEHVTVIRELILRYQGGFAALNDAVQVRMQSWFHTVAGIRFANKRRLSEVGLDEAKGFKHSAASVERGYITVEGTTAETETARKEDEDTDEEFGTTQF